MPELTGTQIVARAAAAQSRRCRSSSRAATAASGFETRALSAGVNRVLKKPYRMSEIAEVLDGFFTQEALVLRVATIGCNLRVVRRAQSRVCGCRTGPDKIGSDVVNSLSRIAEDAGRARPRTTRLQWQGLTLSLAFPAHLFGARGRLRRLRGAGARPRRPGHADRPTSSSTRRSRTATASCSTGSAARCTCARFATIDPDDRVALPERASRGRGARRPRWCATSPISSASTGSRPRRVCVEILEALRRRGAPARGGGRLPRAGRHHRDGRLRHRPLQFRPHRGAAPRRGEDRPLGPLAGGRRREVAPHAARDHRAAARIRRAKSRSKASRAATRRCWRSSRAPTSSRASTSPRRARSCPTNRSRSGSSASCCACAAQTYRRRSALTLGERAPR